MLPWSNWEFSSLLVMSIIQLLLLLMSVLRRGSTTGRWQLRAWQQLDNSFSQPQFLFGQDSRSELPCSWLVWAITHLEKYSTHCCAFGNVWAKKKYNSELILIIQYEWYFAELIQLGKYPTIWNRSSILLEFYVVLFQLYSKFLWAIFSFISFIKSFNVGYKCGALPN